MSQITRQEVLTQLRRRYARAGRIYKAQLLDQAVELFGYHRKAAIRALRARPAAVRAPFVRGRPKSYDPDKLLPPLKAIWLAALQPCGLRLHPCLPDGLTDYEADHRRLDPDVSEATKARLRTERAGLNAFALRPEVDRQLRQIEAVRRGTGPCQAPSSRAEPSTPRDGSEAGRTGAARAASFVLKMGVKLGNTMFESTDPCPPQSSVTPIFELRRGGAHLNFLPPGRKAV